MIYEIVSVRKFEHQRCESVRPAAHAAQPEMHYTAYLKAVLGDDTLNRCKAMEISFLVDPMEPVVIPYKQEFRGSPATAGLPSPPGWVS